MDFQQQQNRDLIFQMKQVIWAAQFTLVLTANVTVDDVKQYAI
jgi:hypothetical protein